MQSVVALALCVAMFVAAHVERTVASSGGSAAPPAVAGEYPAGSHSLTITDSTFADIVASQNVLIYFHDAS